MSAITHLVVKTCGMAVTAASTAYAILAAAVTVRRRMRSRESVEQPGRGIRPESTNPSVPGVTVLKPLCGTEPELYECLRSFCDQVYPRLQVVFGVHHPQDPAVPVVRRLQREFPGLDLDLAIDSTEHGSSLKVSNLINMMRLARHDLLCLSDSDVSVPRDYVQRVVAPLADARIGLVTCSYRGIARGGLWSQLLAAFVNGWFMPTVFVGAALGAQAFVSGVTIALRRDALEAIGGFEAIRDQLADDYRLGELTRLAGLRTFLSEVVVDTYLHETSARQLVRHELRWLRTIRAVRPGGYAGLFFTFGWPVALIGCLLADAARPALVMLAASAAARLLLHFEVRRTGTAVSQLWVLPISDSLAFALWCWGFVSRRVHWRHTRYTVARDGTVQPIS